MSPSLRYSQGGYSEVTTSITSVSPKTVIGQKKSIAGIRLRNNIKTPGYRQNRPLKIA
jgi:hypothetical protein